MGVQSLGQEDPLEEGMASHSSILAWRIPMDRGAWQATTHGVTTHDSAQNRGKIVTNSIKTFFKWSTLKKERKKERQKNLSGKWQPGCDSRVLKSLARPGIYIPLVVDFGWKDGSKEVAEAVRAQQLLVTAQSRNY